MRWLLMLGLMFAVLTCTAGCKDKSPTVKDGIKDGLKPLPAPASPADGGGGGGGQKKPAGKPGGGPQAQ